MAWRLGQWLCGVTPFGHVSDTSAAFKCPSRGDVKLPFLQFHEVRPDGSLESVWSLHRCRVCGGLFVKRN